jgi:vacuolar-type H+-ATPase subunit H
MAAHFRAQGRGDAVVDDKVLEEIQFHQDVIKRDATSPLYQIREKEIEISGRVLAAKQKAEAVVADARRKSAETITRARTDGEIAAREHEASTIATAEKQAAELRSGVGGEVAAIEAQVGQRMSAAVDSVVKAVTAV